MSVVIGFNPVNYKAEDRIMAQKTAIEVLSNAPQDVIPVALGFRGDLTNSIVKSHNIYALNCLKRDSQKEIDNSRRLPYIKEIFNILSKIDCEIFGFINSDILIGKKAFDLLKENRDAYIFPRFEIEKITSEEFLNDKIEIISDKHAGVDGFFFKREWWLKNEGLFGGIYDNLLTSEQAWDNCYRDIIKEHSKNHVEERVIYHIRHKEGWNLESNGAKNNGKIWFDHWGKKLEKEAKHEREKEWRRFEEERLEKLKGMKK